MLDDADEGPVGGRTLFRGLWAVLVKEFVHIRRQPTTLFFMFVVPLIQTILFGYAIETQIENIPMVVLDLDGRTPAQVLIESFSNTRRFDLVERVFDQSAFDHAVQSGRAQVGVVVPPDFSERLLLGEQAQVQVLIDGSDSQVASTAQSTAQLLGQTLSIQLAQVQSRVAPVGSGTGQRRNCRPRGRCQDPVALQPRPGKLPFFCARTDRHHPTAGDPVPDVVCGRSRTGDGDARAVVCYSRQSQRTHVGEVDSLRGRRDGRSGSPAFCDDLHFRRPGGGQPAAAVCTFAAVYGLLAGVGIVHFHRGENPVGSVSVCLRGDVAVDFAVRIHVSPSRDAAADLLDFVCVSGHVFH